MLLRYSFVAFVRFPAHGVTGILYILMLAHWRFTPARDPSSRMRQLVLGTLDYCLSIRLPSGNFPSSEHDDEDDTPSDKLVQVSFQIEGF